MKNLVLFFKSHIDTFTRKDGSVVQAHDDKRQAHMDTLKKFHAAHVPDSDNHHSHVPDHKMREFDKGHIEALKKDGHIEHGDIATGFNEYDDTGHYITAKGKKALAEHGKAPAKDWRDEENWHTRTMEKMKTHSEDELRYIHKDATEAAETGERSGFDSKKTGKYRDEAHYASMELKKRQDAKKAPK